MYQYWFSKYQFSSVQLLNPVGLFVTPWIANVKKKYMFIGIFFGFVFAVVVRTIFPPQIKPFNKKNSMQYIVKWILHSDRNELKKLNQMEKFWVWNNKANYLESFT